MVARPACFILGNGTERPRRGAGWRFRGFRRNPRTPTPPPHKGARSSTTKERRGAGWRFRGFRKNPPNPHPAPAQDEKRGQRTRTTQGLRTNQTNGLGFSLSFNSTHIRIVNECGPVGDAADRNGTRGVPSGHDPTSERPHTSKRKIFMWRAVCLSFYQISPIGFHSCGGLGWHNSLL